MTKSRLIFWAITASLAGFLFGFDTIVISGAEQAFKKEWQLGDWLHGWAIAAALWGTVVGAMFGGFPAAAYGRKKTLIVIGFLYLISAIASAFAPEVWSFMVARFIGGLGVGAATVASPMFISEISPANNRGKLAGMFQFNIVFGILVAFLSNYLFGNLMSKDVAWRWMLGIEAIPALAYTILSFTLPESPRWLITHAGKRDEGAKIFRQINPAATDEEIEKLVTEVEATVRDKQKVAKFWTMRLRVPILLAFLIALFNQFSGINIILYFAPRLLGLAGLQNALLASVALGVTNLIFTFVGLWLIDKLGRRSLLYIGSFGYILSLGICAWAFLSTPTLEVTSAAKNLADSAGTLVNSELDPSHEDYVYISPDDLEGEEGLKQEYADQKAALVKISDADWYEGEKVIFDGDESYDRVKARAESCLKEAGGLLGSTSMIVLICLVGFIAAHAVGQGAVIWVFIAEIFPNDHRAAGQALGSSTHWVCAAALTTLFPIAQGMFQPGYLFGFFCFMMCLQLLWVKLMVPETKGITLEEMEKKLGIDY